jgi:AmiR/NasT family two-component response regulator
MDGVDVGEQGTVRVLVAEDEALIRLDLVESLRDLGYEVAAEAADGESALRLARSVPIDVALLDISMPLLDGLSVASELTAAGTCAVVVVTAFSQREVVARAVEAGAMAYVVKPFTPADLAPAIELARTRFAELRALQDNVGELTDRLAARKVIEQAKAALVTAYGMSEADAFRFLQKKAMDDRVPMAAVAEQVLAKGRG